MTEERRTQRVVARPCTHCGAEFVPMRLHQRFCRPSCRWEAFKARRRLPLFDDGDVLAVDPVR